MAERLTDLIISGRLTIPAEELRWKAVRSSGPGGQNVNKVNSRVILEWTVTTSPSLPEPVRARFLEQFGTRVSGEGILALGSDEYRDQPRNLQSCLDRLAEMIRSVLIPPKPRRATKPSRASQRRRVEGKLARGQTKQQRRRPGGDE